MFKKALHRIRWNSIANELDSDRVAIRGRNLTVAEETALCERIAAKQIEYLKLSPTDKVLDIGCSEGFFTREFASHSSQVTGMDYAQKMIEIAIRKGATIPNVSYEVGSILELPYEDNSFTKVNCFSVIQYLENYAEVQKAFDEITRVLAPNGMAYIGDIYSSKRELLKIIHAQEVGNGTLSAALGYVINSIIFSIFPPTLFFTEEQLREFSACSSLEVKLCRNTIDEPYETIGKDILVKKPP